MPLPEFRDHRAEEMDFANADAVEPDAGSVAFTQQGMTAELSPKPTAILAGGQGFIDEVGEGPDQKKSIGGIEEVSHENPFSP
jgi:hypothetical protein